MSPNPPRPLALSDAQMTALLRASAPLDRDLREPFLLAVARALQGREPLGVNAADVLGSLERDYPRADLRAQAAIRAGLKKLLARWEKEKRRARPSASDHSPSAHA